MLSFEALLRLIEVQCGVMVRFPKTLKILASLNTMKQRLLSQVSLVSDGSKLAVEFKFIMRTAVETFFNSIYVAR